MRRIMLLMILFAVGCGHKSHRSKQISKTPPPLEIEVAEVIQRAIASTMTFACQTYGLREIKIEPRVAGYLREIGYEEGMPVRKGQRLISIEQDEYLADVASAEASVASAIAQKVNAQNTYNRYLPLAKRNAISQSSLDSATADLLQASADVKSAKATLRSAQTNLSYTDFYAPFDGIIGATNGSVGEYVGVGTEYEIINTISDLDSIYVHLSIPARIYLTLVQQEFLGVQLFDNQHLLSNIRMRLSSGELYPYEGAYKFTERAVNSETGSVVIYVLFPNPERILKSGEYVSVEADLGSMREKMLIPSRAVMQTQGSNGVFTVDAKGVVRYRAVTLGETHGTLWEVLSGLNPQDRVLVEGLQKVHNGETIKPILTKK